MIVIQLVIEWKTEGGCRRRMSHLGWQCHLGVRLGAAETGACGIQTGGVAGTTEELARIEDGGEHGQW